MVRQTNDPCQIGTHVVFAVCSASLLAAAPGVAEADVGYLGARAFLPGPSARAESPVAHQKGSVAGRTVQLGGTGSYQAGQVVRRCPRQAVGQGSPEGLFRN